MQPVVDRLKDEYEGKVEFKLYDVEKSEEGAEVAQGYGVQVVPTFVFTNADGSFSDQVVGALTEERLRASLDALR